MLKSFSQIKERTKDLTRKQKFDYYWDYYKFYAFASIVAVAILGDYIYNKYTEKDMLFYGAFINALPMENEEKYLREQFIDTFGIDENIYELTLDSSLYIDFESENFNTIGQEKLILLIADKELDIVATDETTFKYLAYDTAFIDLTTCLSQEELETYSDYFYYIDQDTLNKIHTDTSEDFYNHEMPNSYEEMVNPIPVGLKIDDTVQMGKSYVFKDSKGVMGIVQNTQRLQSAKDFISVAMD